MNYKFFYVPLIASVLFAGCAGDPDDEATATASTTAVCASTNDLTNIPTAYVTAMTKYTTTNTSSKVYVCTQDSDGDGNADFMVVESTNVPEHKSVYFETSNALYKAYDFVTNKFKFSSLYTASRPLSSAGTNKISSQTVLMKMPITPASASTKTATGFNVFGIALNGVGFFNENASPPNDITDELFTFDYCSGHPQNSGVYHYHVDPVCLIRDLSGTVKTNTTTDSGRTYTWIEDAGTNAGLLLGFLMDGFPVYGPVGTGEKDNNGTAVTTAIDTYNGHSHSTTEFSSAVYHYHVKTAALGGADSTAVFWITNTSFYGTPGSVTVYEN
jgi:hypothetical protein